MPVSAFNKARSKDEDGEPQLRERGGKAGGEGHRRSGLAGNYVVQAVIRGLSSSRINTPKFFCFSLNGLEETVTSDPVTSFEAAPGPQLHRVDRQPAPGMPEPMMSPTLIQSPTTS